MKKWVEFEEEKFNKQELRYENDLMEMKNSSEYERGRLNMEKNDNSDICNED